MAYGSATILNTGNEVDVAQTLTLTNITISSTPTTLPIDDTPAPMYVITVDDAEITLDTLGSAPEKTIWFKNAASTTATLIAAEGSTIDGIATCSLQPGIAVQLWTDGVSDWWVVAASGAPWSFPVQMPADTTGGVLIRDDWDNPNNADPGGSWIGLVPLNGNAFAGLLLQNSQYQPGVSAPYGIIGNFVTEIYNTNFNIQDLSFESLAQYNMQITGEGEGPFEAQMLLQSDTDTDDSVQAFWVKQGDAFTFQVRYGGELDISGDAIFQSDDVGPVLADQSDGHTYRIISTAGVLSTVQVT